MVDAVRVRSGGEPRRGGGGTGRQASRAISTARLNASLRLRPRPIEVVVYDRAWGHFWREDLSWGQFIIFYDISIEVYSVFVSIYKFICKIYITC